MAAGGMITIPAGQSILVRMIDGVDSSKNHVGDIFHASLETDLNEAQTELGGLADVALACVDRLEELGVVLKDLDLGLLDFPSVRDGEDVLLCWQVGEEAVTSWHGLEEGFAGRKPIDWSE